MPIHVRLPALEKFMDELQGDKPVSTVTAHLATALYRVQAPQQVRAAAALLSAPWPSVEEQCVKS